MRDSRESRRTLELGDGRSSINIEFSADRDVDAAANDGRDRVGRVIDDLPEEASPPEIQKAESGPEAVVFLNLSSDRMSVLELTDFAERVLIDQLSAIPGVARVCLYGERRQAVRIWIDRQALAARALTVADIESALRRENVELPAGRLESSEREFALRTDTGLAKVEDFRRLALGRGPDGYVVRLGDVARVELGAENTTIVKDAWARGQEFAVHGWIYGLHDGLLRNMKFFAARSEDVDMEYLNAIHHISNI